MRNLKRVLSLALASAMLLGMMVIGAGAAETKKTAADLTDLDKVTNKTAVSLLVDLGIITGKPDGSYGPTETVDRATMAKLVYFVLQGDANADIYKGTSGLKDVTAHWAEGFINYCYSLNIIAGDGAGNFLPANKVTTVAAAKMLLVALGYDAIDRGYTNDSQWSIKIMKDAQSNGLLKNVDQGANEELTRDSAAQMIYNALFAKTVEAVYSRDNGEKYVSSYKELDTLGYVTYKLVEVTAKLAGVKPTTVAAKPTFAPAFAAGSDPAVNSIKGFGDLEANSADIGKTVVFYINSDAKLISSTLGLSSKTTSNTVPDNLKVGTSATVKDSVMKYLKDNGLSFPATDAGDAAKDDVVVVTNGTEATATNAAAAMAAIATVTADGITAGAKAGDIITLIDSNSDAVIDRISIIHKTAVALTGDAVTKTVSGELQVKVPGVTGVQNYTDAKLVKGYEDLKEKDVVLYYKDTASGITYIELAESITGTVSSIKGSTVTIDGTSYKASAATYGDTDTLAAYITAGNTGVDMTAYIDNNGNIFKINNDKEEAADYAVVLDIVWVNKIGAGNGTGGYVEAQLLLADGTTTVVKIDAIGADDSLASGDETLATANTMVKYLVNKDGNYELTTITDAALITANISKGVASVTASGKTVTFNNSTVFLYATKGSNNKVTYTVYTGYKNAPSTTSTGTATQISASSLQANGAAKYVFVTALAANVGDATADYVYVTDKVFSTSGSGSDRVYTFGGAVNGVTTDGIKTQNTTVRDALAASKGLYKVNINADGYVTSVVDAPADLANKLGKASANASDGTVSMTTDTGATLTAGVYTYDDDATVYVIDGDDFYEGSMSDLKKDYTAYIMTVGTTGADQWAIKTAYVIVNNNI